jgi:hypothetical protein
MIYMYCQPFVPGSILNVRDPQFGAVGNDITDDTNAIKAALAAAGAQSTVYIPKGTYKVTSEILVSLDRVRLVGDGVNQTILKFYPTASGSLLKVSNGAAINFQSGIYGMTITSQDTTYQKVALDLWDVSELQIRDISIAGANGYWRGGGGSIGVRTQGREFSTFKNLTVFAEKPLVIAGNPNHTIDIDHFHFDDLYLSGYGAFPLITVDSGVNLSNVTFDGAQPWVGGTHAFYWNDTASTFSSYNLAINNVRTEQAADLNGWSVYIARNQSLYGLTLRNFYTDARNGFYLRNVYNAVMDAVTYTGPRVALDYNGTNWGLTGRGCYFLAGSTATIAGQNMVWAAPKFPATAPLPSAFQFHNAVLAPQTTFMSAGLSQPVLTLPHNGVTSLGFGTMKGVLSVTTSGGDSAMLSLAGEVHAVVKMSDPNSRFAVTSGSAGTTNVYWNPASARYVLENKSGDTLKYSLVLLGVNEGF